VDDDPGILKAISRLLASDFNVVATATTGSEALDTVPRLDPDLVVLDMSMPGLNGLQTAAELKRSGSRAPVVFLTMHQDDDIVADALRSGATGYVLKTRAWSDLVPALRDALVGRKYLPSLAPLLMTDAHPHAVQFHGDDDDWLDGVTEALIGALHRGDIIATVLIESNRHAVTRRMAARGWNLADLETQNRYLVFDADEAAKQVMRDGRPHVDSIAAMVAVLENARLSSAAGSRSQVTLIGEIAGVLCRRGDFDGALELERLWDELTASLPILTICAYPTACFHDDRAQVVVSDISAHHSVISHSESAWRP